MLRKKLPESAQGSTPGPVTGLDDEMTGTLAEPFARLEHPAIGRLVEPGDRLGQYRVGRLLGRGGTGDVFLGYGVRANSQRRVAVKVLQRGLSTSAFRERFENECRILSALEHPNIAKLYDARATDSVRPYVIMEYVDGERIDAYCDRLRLPIPDRLALVRDVCSAIELAHSQRVVHLDIKPGNILVTDQGVPKLLDFGIAKWLGGDGGAIERSGVTRASFPAHHPMTLGYASPEQVSGSPLTAATDVYSLGMLLYKLLAGRLPFPAARLRNETQRQRFLARAATPLPPSEAFEIPAKKGAVVAGESRGETVARLRSTTVERLRQHLAADLDHLVLRAIEHQPADRFESALALAQAL